MLEYRSSNASLGGTIGALCLLLGGNQPISLDVTAQSSLIDLKRILKIPSSKLCLNIVNNVNALDANNIHRPSRLNDNPKTFSSYSLTDTVCLFGKDFSLLNNKRKPCIGITIAPDAYMAQDIFLGKADFTVFPGTRNHNKDVYLSLFELIISAGYDIITINSRIMDLESKAFQLTNLCDCVIGYEGGVAHLAHVLKVPYIMLPWHSYEDRFTAQKLHLDKRTYFLKSADELLNWTTQELVDKINELKNNQGNNMFLLDQTLTNEFDQLVKIFAVPEFAECFVKNHYVSRSLGGF